MNGVILINKPIDFTSRDVVNVVSKALNTRKVGHTGTLDPIATGVLILCIGNATKIVDLITSYNKEYIATVILGIETDTLDITGNIINESVSNNISKCNIEEVLSTFIGKIKQQVPKYSAVKVNGRKLYEYARNGIEIELPVREIEVFDIKLIDDIIYEENSVKFKIKCSVSKGTYIRSLIRDIGIKLGTYATMESLIRTKQGEFNIEECYTLDDVKSNNYKLIPIKEILHSLPTVIVDKDTEFKVKNGAVVDRFFDGNQAVVYNEFGDLLAIYETYDKDIEKVRPYKMF